MRTDSLFYQLFQTFPSVVLELLGNPDYRASTYSFSSQEVKQTSFRLDGILTPPANLEELPIYFIEVQGYSDGEFYPRLFSEIFLYLKEYRPANDWQAVVMFTQKRFDSGLPLHYQDFAASSRLSRIYLDELTTAVKDSSLELGILQLIGVNSEVAPERARQLIQRTREELADTASQRQIVELVETVMIYKFPNLSRQEIEQMFGLSELKQTRYFQEVLAEGVEQGRQEGELAIVVRLLTRRLGTLESNLQSQLQQLSSNQLEELAEALLDFTTTADLTTWLQNYPQ